MTCISVAIKIVVCAAISLLVVKLAVDQQRVAWHSKRLLQPEKCSDILIEAGMNADNPNWRIFADQLVKELEEADEHEASLPFPHVHIPNHS